MKVLFRVAVYVGMWAMASCGGADRQLSQHQQPERCDKWERRLPKDAHGRTVVVVEQGCSGFSNGLRIAIDLAFADGTRATIFQYEDASWNAAYYGQSTPVIEWIGNDRLKISVGAVGAIEKEIDRLRDVAIEYHIGHVLYK
jgi:hypothetical protein